KSPACHPLKVPFQRKAGVRLGENDNTLRGSGHLRVVPEVLHLLPSLAQFRNQMFAERTNQRISRARINDLRIPTPARGFRNGGSSPPAHEITSQVLSTKASRDSFSVTSSEPTSPSRCLAIMIWSLPLHLFCSFRGR